MAIITMIRIRRNSATENDGHPAVAVESCHKSGGGAESSQAHISLWSILPAVDDSMGDTERLSDVPCHQRWGCGWITSSDLGPRQHAEGLGAAAGTGKSERGKEKVDGVTQEQH